MKYSLKCYIKKSCEKSLQFFSKSFLYLLFKRKWQKPNGKINCELLAPFDWEKVQGKIEKWLAKLLQYYQNILTKAFVLFSIKSFVKLVELMIRFCEKYHWTMNSSKAFDKNYQNYLYHINMILKQNIQKC